MSYRASVRRGRLLVCLCFVVAGCGRCGGRTNAPDASPVSSSSASGDAGVQCAQIGSSTRWGGAGGDVTEGAPVPFAAEIGAGAADDHGFVVGARASGADGAVAVLRVDASTGVTRELARPSTKGTARAPLVDADHGKIVVGTLLVEEGARVFHLDAASDDGALSAIGDVVQAADESEATALLVSGDGALVAWDDADPTGAFGRVRLVRVVRVDPSTPPTSPSASSSASAMPPASSASATPPPLDVVSPPTSDASWPVLARSPDGRRAALLWLAERPEASDEGPDAAPGEPTQAEAFRWVEARVVDVATGKPIGAVRALTSRDGHAQTMDAVWTSRGLSVALRDDARPTDADGGTLLSVHASIDDAGVIGEPTSNAVARDDLSAGVPSVFALGDAIYAGILGVNDAARLVSLDSGSAFGAPSLDGRRIVAARADTLLAARSSGAALELMIVRCPR